MPKRKSAPGGADEGMVVLHRSTFIEWQPSPIVALSSSHDGSLCAAVRENGDVELYESSTLHQLQRVPGHSDASPTSIALVDQGDDAACRIFTAGLDGNIIEIDLEHYRSGAAIDSHGGAVWQLAIEPFVETSASIAGTLDKKPPGLPGSNSNAAGDDENSEEEDIDQDKTSTEHSLRLAAACDDGCVRLFTIEPGMPGAVYHKSLPRVEGRTLAVAWHPSRKFLISSGSDGCIHVWDVSTNREALRITANDGTGNSELCIWSLLVLPDGTIVAGDSCGNVSFYDGQFGTLLGRFTQHHADVLQLAASPDGNTVFAAGVDPKIAVFQKINGGNGGGGGLISARKSEWVYLSSKRPHTHDVRAMCVASSPQSSSTISGDHTALLFTGGNDTLLLAHSVARFLKEHPKKVNSCPQRPIIQAAAAVHTGVGSRGGHAEHAEPWLMAAAGNKVDLWKLSRPSSSLSSASANGTSPYPTPAAPSPAKAAAGATAAIEGDRLAPQNVPLHLARVVNCSGELMTAAAISNDGLYLAYSDAYRLHCFAVSVSVFSPNDNAEGDGVVSGMVLPPRVRVTPITLPDEDFPPAVDLFFKGEEETTLVALAADGTVRLLTMPSHPRSSHTEGGNDEDSEEESEEERKEEEVLVASLGQTLRELHDLRYKMWYKRDRARTTARKAVPAVELATISPDGRLLAVSVRGRVQLLPLEGHKITASIPPPAEHIPLTALGFTPDSASLVMVTAKNQVVAYQMPSGAPTEWSQNHPPEALPKRVLSLPGSIVGVALSPTGPSSVLLYSSEAVCHIDFAATVPSEPSSSSGRRKKRQREVSTAVRTATPAGENCRALYCSDPVLHVEALGGNEVVVVERSWSDVYRNLAPPMYRHRYGT
ncbi:putative WD repeat-containing protein PCN [Nannochloris sp. 'desiccata']|nr:putative WD repeat-containing protein PCN [Chlorella desiccata (nom. nud.)]